MVSGSGGDGVCYFEKPRWSISALSLTLNLDRTITFLSSDRHHMIVTGLKRKERWELTKYSLFDLFSQSKTSRGRAELPYISGTNQKNPVTDMHFCMHGLFVSFTNIFPTGPAFTHGNISHHPSLPFSHLFLPSLTSWDRDHPFHTISCTSGSGDHLTISAPSRSKRMVPPDSGLLSSPLTVPVRSPHSLAPRKAAINRQLNF